MKKALALLLIFAMLLSLGGCLSFFPLEDDTPVTPTSEPPVTQPEPDIEPVGLDPLTDLSWMVPENGSVIAATVDDFRMAVLIQDADCNTQLTVLDMETGLYTQMPVSALNAEPVTSEFSDAGISVYAMSRQPNGTIAVICSVGGKGQLLWLSEGGDCVDSRELSNWDRQNVFAYDRKKDIFCYDDANGSMFLVPMNGDETEQISSLGWLMGAHDGKLVVEQEQGMALVDPFTSESLSLDWLESTLFWKELGGYRTPSYSLSKFMDSCPTVVYHLNEPETVYQIRDIGDVLYQSPSGQIFTWTKTDTGGTLQALLPEQGLLLDSQTIGQNGFFPSHFSDNGNALVIAGYGENGPMLYLWRYTMQQSRDIPVERIDYATLGESIYALSDRVMEETGVLLLPGNYGQIPYNDGYEFITSGKDFSYYLTMLDCSIILDLFPREVIRDILTPEYTSFELYIVDSMVPTDEYGITTATGVAFTSDEHRVIALCNGNAEVLPHELMHVMEDRIQGKINAEPVWRDYVGYWESLVPEGFFYYWSYHYDEDSPEANRWVFQSDAQDPVWFIDSYSKTYPKEDRARILEHLFLQNMEYFEGNPHMTEKAAYLCALLRWTFGYEEAVWEENIPQRELWEYNELVENFELPAAG